MCTHRAALTVLATVLIAATAFGQGPVFENEDLRNARFERCDMQMARFVDCRFDGVQLLNIRRGAKMTVRHSRLDDAVFEYATLRNPRMERSGIEGLEGYDLTLTDWDLRQSRLEKLALKHCSLRYITLERSEVRDFRSEWSTVAGGRWQGTDLSRSDFEGCDFSGGNFYRGSVRDARFRNVDFTNVRLENCDVRGLVINGVRIDELIN